MRIKKIFDDNHLAFQEAEFTCGPVTLMNLMHLKGDFSHNEKELSKLCDAKPETGTAEPDMVKAARKLGLEIVEQKQDSKLEDIERNIDDGNFVIVCYFHAFAGDGHYALVSEYDDKAFYLRDCSLGLVRLKKKYFERHWHGSDETYPRWFLATK